MSSPITTKKEIVQTILSIIMSYQRDIIEIENQRTQNDTAAESPMDEKLKRAQEIVLNLAKENISEYKNILCSLIDDSKLDVSRLSSIISHSERIKEFEQERKSPKIKK